MQDSAKYSQKPSPKSPDYVQTTCRTPTHIYSVVSRRTGFRRFMSRLIFSILLALASLHAHVRASSEGPLPTYEEAEAYEVYAAILPDEWSWKDAKAKWVVLRQATISYEMCLAPDIASQHLLGRRSPTVFRRTNNRRCSSANSISINPILSCPPRKRRPPSCEA